MGKINTIIVLITLYILTTFSQTFEAPDFLSPSASISDSSVLDYFPLHKGNLWQYMYSDGFGGYLENMVSYGDTIMPNGLKYTYVYPAPYEGPSRVKYYRIDSLYRVQEYIDSSCRVINYDTTYCDSCIINSDINTFRLNEPDSSHWTTCFNIGTNLFWPELQYLGEYKIEIFNQTWDAKLFIQYHKYYDAPNDRWVDLYGGRYILVKGLGFYYGEFRESSSATLQGAIINGVKYGTVVGVAEQNQSNAISFVLHQNYPNPFNPTTTIQYEIPRDGFVTLEIYDILGREVATLVNERKSAGTYITEFDASNLASGMYIYRLQTPDFVLSKKMLMIK